MLNQSGSRAYYSKITEFRAGFCELLKQHLTDDELEISKARAEISKTKASTIEELLDRRRQAMETKLRHYMELVTLLSQILDVLGEDDPK